MVLRDFQVRPEDILEASRQRRQRLLQQPTPNAFPTPPPRFTLPTASYQDPRPSMAARWGAESLRDNPNVIPDVDPQKLLGEVPEEGAVPKRSLYRGVFQDLVANPKEDTPTYYVPRAPRMEREPDSTGILDSLKWYGGVTLDAVSRNFFDPIVGVGASLFEGPKSISRESYIEDLLDQYPRHKTFGYSGLTQDDLRPQVEELFDELSARYADFVPQGDYMTQSWGAEPTRTDHWAVAYHALKNRYLDRMPTITAEMQAHRDDEILMEREIDYAYNLTKFGQTLGKVFSGEARSFDRDEIIQRLATDESYALYDDWKDSAGIPGILDKITRLIPDYGNPLSAVPIVGNVVPTIPYTPRGIGRAIEGQQKVARWRYAEERVRLNAGIPTGDFVDMIRDRSLNLEDIQGAWQLYGQAHAEDHQLPFGAKMFMEIVSPIELVIPFEKPLIAGLKYGAKGLRSATASGKIWATTGKDFQGFYRVPKSESFLNLRTGDLKDYGNGVDSRHVDLFGTPAGREAGGLGDIYDLEGGSGIYRSDYFPNVTLDSARKRYHDLQDNSWSWGSENRILRYLTDPVRALGRNLIGWRFEHLQGGNIARAAREMRFTGDRHAKVIETILSRHLTTDKSRGPVMTFSTKSRVNPVFHVDDNGVIQNLPSSVGRLLGEKKYHVFEYLYQQSFARPEIMAILKNEAPDMYNFIERRRLALAALEEQFQSMGIGYLYEYMFGHSLSPLVTVARKGRAANISEDLTRMLLSRISGKPSPRSSVRDLIDEGHVFADPAVADAIAFREIVGQNANVFQVMELQKLGVDITIEDLITGEYGSVGNRAKRAARDFAAKATRVTNESRGPTEPDAPEPEAPEPEAPTPEPPSPDSPGPDAPAAEAPTPEPEPEPQPFDPPAFSTEEAEEFMRLIREKSIFGGLSSEDAINWAREEILKRRESGKRPPKPDFVGDPVVDDDLGLNETTLVAELIDEPIYKSSVQLGRSDSPKIADTVSSISSESMWLAHPDQRIPLSAIKFSPFADSSLTIGIEILASMIASVQGKSTRSHIDYLINNFYEGVVIDSGGEDDLARRVWGLIAHFDSVIHGVDETGAISYWTQQRDSILPGASWTIDKVSARSALPPPTPALPSPPPPPPTPAPEAPVGDVGLGVQVDIADLETPEYGGGATPKPAVEPTARQEPSPPVEPADVSTTTSDIAQHGPWWIASRDRNNNLVKRVYDPASEQISLDASSPDSILGKLENPIYSAEALYQNVVLKYKSGRYITETPAGRMPIAYKEVFADILNRTNFGNFVGAQDSHFKDYAFKVLRAVDDLEDAYYLKVALGEIDPLKYPAKSREELIDYVRGTNLPVSSTLSGVVLHGDIIDHAFKIDAPASPKDYASELLLKYDSRNKDIRDQFRLVKDLAAEAEVASTVADDALRLVEDLQDPSHAAEYLLRLDRARQHPDRTLFEHSESAKEVLARRQQRRDARDLRTEEQLAQDAFNDASESISADSPDPDELLDSGRDNVNFWFSLLEDSNLSIASSSDEIFNRYESLAPDFRSWNKNWESEYSDWVKLAEEFYDRVGGEGPRGGGISMPSWDFEVIKLARNQLIRDEAEGMKKSVQRALYSAIRAHRVVEKTREHIDISAVEIDVIDRLLSSDLQDLDSVVDNLAELVTDELDHLPFVIRSLRQGVLADPVMAIPQARRSVLENARRELEQSSLSYKNRERREMKILSDARAVVDSTLKQIRAHNARYSDPSVQVALDRIDEINKVLVKAYSERHRLFVRAEFYKRSRPWVSEDTVDDVYGDWYKASEDAIRSRMAHLSGIILKHEHALSELNFVEVPGAPTASESVMARAQSQAMQSFDARNTKLAEFGKAKGDLYNLLQQTHDDHMRLSGDNRELLRRHGIEIMDRQRQIAMVYEFDAQDASMLFKMTPEEVEQIYLSWVTSKPRRSGRGGFPEFDKDKPESLFRSEEWLSQKMELEHVGGIGRNDAISTSGGQGYFPANAVTTDSGAGWVPDTSPRVRTDKDEIVPFNSPFADVSEYVDPSLFMPQFREIDWNAASAELGNLSPNVKDNLLRLFWNAQETELQLSAALNEVLGQIGVAALVSRPNINPVVRDILKKSNPARPIPPTLAGDLVAALANDSRSFLGLFVYDRLRIAPETFNLFTRVYKSYIESQQQVLRFFEDYNLYEDFDEIWPKKYEPKAAPNARVFGWESGRAYNVGNPREISTKDALSLPEHRATPGPEVEVYDLGGEQALPNPYVERNGVAIFDASSLEDGTRTMFHSQFDRFGKLHPHVSTDIFLPGNGLISPIAKSPRAAYEYFRWSNHPGVQKAVIRAKDGAAAKKVSMDYQRVYGPQNINPYSGMLYVARLMVAQHYDRLAPMLREARLAPDGSKKRIFMIGDSFWGMSVKFDKNEMTGSNLMGKIWEEIADAVIENPRAFLERVPAPNFNLGADDYGAFAGKHDSFWERTNPDGSVKEPVLVNQRHAQAVDLWIGGGPYGLPKDVSLEDYPDWLAQQRQKHIPGYTDVDLAHFAGARLGYWIKAGEGDGHFPALKEAIMDAARKLARQGHVYAPERTGRYVAKEKALGGIVVNKKLSGTPPRGSYIYIGRNKHDNGDWGNPYFNEDRRQPTNEERVDFVDKHQLWLNGRIRNGEVSVEALADLTRNDKKLLCFCHPDLCHGHTLAYYSAAARRGNEALSEAMEERTVDWYNQVQANSGRSRPSQQREVVRLAEADLRREYSDVSRNISVEAAERTLVDEPVKRLAQVFHFLGGDAFMNALRIAAEPGQYKPHWSNPFRNARTFNSSDELASLFESVDDAIILTGHGNHLKGMNADDARARRLLTGDSALAARIVATNVLNKLPSRVRLTNISGQGASYAAVNDYTRAGRVFNDNDGYLVSLTRTTEDAGSGVRGGGNVIPITTSQGRKTGALALNVQGSKPGRKLVISMSGDWNTTADTARALLMGRDVLLVRPQNPFQSLFDDIEQSPLVGFGNEEARLNEMLEAVWLLGQLSYDIWASSVWRSLLGDEHMDIIDDFANTAYDFGLSYKSLMDRTPFPERDLDPDVKVRGFGKPVGGFVNTPELQDMRLRDILRDMGDGTFQGSLANTLSNVYEARSNISQLESDASRAKLVQDEARFLFGESEAVDEVSAPNIRSVQGDILQNREAEALVNTVNSVGVMGKGLAKQFKDKYSGTPYFAEYQEAVRSGELRPGKVHVSKVGGQYIVNFPTKAHYRDSSQLSYITDGLDDLRRVIQETGIKSIAIPQLGSGLGGLNWADVRPEIVRKLGGLDVDVMLYEPLDAPAGRTQVRPGVTPPASTTEVLPGGLNIGIVRNFLRGQQTIQRDVVLKNGMKATKTMDKPGRYGLKPSFERSDFTARDFGISPDEKKKVRWAPQELLELNARRKNRLSEWQFFAGRTSRMTTDPFKQLREAHRVLRGRQLRFAEDPVGVAAEVRDDAQYLARFLNDAQAVEALSLSDQRLARYVLDRLSQELRLLGHVAVPQGGADDLGGARVGDYDFPLDEGAYRSQEPSPDELPEAGVEPTIDPAPEEPVIGHHQLDAEYRRSEATVASDNQRIIEQELEDVASQQEVVDSHVTTLENMHLNAVEALAHEQERVTAGAGAGAGAGAPPPRGPEPTAGAGAGAPPPRGSEPPIEDDWYFDRVGGIAPEEQFKAWLRYNNPDTAVNKILEGINKWISDPVIRLRTGYDFGFLFDNLAHLLFARPQDVPRYFKLMFQAFTNPGIFDEFLARHADYHAEMTRYGVEVLASDVEVFRRPGSDYVASNSGRTTAFEDISNSAHRLLNESVSESVADLWMKGVGGVSGFSKRFQTAFDMVLLRYNTERWITESPSVARRAREAGLDVDLELTNYAQTLNRQSMLMSNTFSGVTPTGAAARRAFLAFAPTQTLSSLSLFADVLKKGPNRPASISRLKRGAIGLALGYTLIALALQQKPNFDPRDPEFMTVRIGDRVIGMQSAMRWTVKFGAGLATDALSWNNPKDTIWGAITTRMSPAVNLAHGTIKPKTFDGIPIDQPNEPFNRYEELAKNFTPFSVEDIMFDSGARNGGGVLASIIDFFGGDGYEKSPGSLLVEERDRLAQSRFGVFWKDLEGLQQHSIETSEEGKYLRELTDASRAYEEERAYTSSEKSKVVAMEQERIAQANWQNAVSSVSQQKEALASVSPEVQRAEMEKRPIQFLRAVDGDTVIVLLDGMETRIRLPNFNAPEIDDKGQTSLTVAEKEDLTRQAVMKFVASEPGQFFVQTSNEFGFYGRLLGDIISPSGLSLQESLVAAARARGESVEYWASDVYGAQRQLDGNGSGKDLVYIQDVMRNIQEANRVYYESIRRNRDDHPDAYRLIDEEVGRAWSEADDSLSLRGSLLYNRYIDQVLTNPALYNHDKEFNFRMKAKLDAQFAQQNGGEEALAYVKKLQRTKFTTHDWDPPSALAEYWHGIDVFARYFEDAEEYAIKHSSELGMVDEDLIRWKFDEYASLGVEAQKDFLEQNGDFRQVRAIAQNSLKRFRKMEDPMGRDLDVFGYRAGWWDDLTNSLVAHTDAKNYFSFNPDIKGPPYVYDRVPYKDTTLSRGQ